MAHSAIRLDHRATELFNDMSLPDASGKRGAIYDAVRAADLVIDCNDQIIKSRSGQVPRPAMMDDIERSVLIQGE